MDSTKTIAEAFSRALIDGLVPNQEVVAWVDGVIMSTEEPHFALLDASLSVSDRNALLSSLHELPGYIEPLLVLKRHMGYMLRALMCDPTKAQVIARSLYMTALNGGASGSTMEGPMWAFDDDLDLARAGYFGDVDAITNELTAFLAEHASAV